MGSESQNDTASRISAYLAPAGISLPARSDNGLYEGAPPDMVGGRGGAPVLMTNLAGDRTPGSFTHLMEDVSGPRQILPAVAGTVTLPNNRPVWPRHSSQNNVSYLGFTAPQHGVEIIGWSPTTGIKGNMVITEIDNVYMTDLSLRIGPVPDCSVVSSGSNVLQGKGRNQLFRRITGMWATDQVWNTNRKTASNIVFDQCWFGEPLHNSTAAGSCRNPGQTHGFGSLIYSLDDAPMSFRRSVVAHCRRRAPSFGTGIVDMQDSVIYDCEVGTFLGYVKSGAQVRGVWYIDGPDSLSGTGNNDIHVSTQSFRNVYGAHKSGLSNIYIDDCKHDRAGAITEASVRTHGLSRTERRQLSLSDFNGLPLNSDYTSMGSDNVVAHVTAHVGSFKWNRDQNMQRVINNMINRTGGWVDCVGGAAVTSANHGCARNVPWYPCPDVTDVAAHPVLDDHARYKIRPEILIKYNLDPNIDPWQSATSGSNIPDAELVLLAEYPQAA